MVEEWLSKNLVGPKEMMQLKNAKTGIIIFKAEYEITTGIGIAHFPMIYTVTIKSKRQRVIIYL